MKELMQSVSHFIETVRLRWKRQGWRWLRSIAVTVAGFLLIIIGLIMIFLPGPALIILPLGLAILGTQYAWPKKVLNYFKYHLHRLRYAIFPLRGRKS